METINISTLRDDAVRASFLADHVDSPEEALRILAESTEAYTTEHGLDRLPEDVCGPVMATVGAAMVGSLVNGFGPSGEWEGNPVELLIKSQTAAEVVNHAAYDHGDSLAMAIREPFGNAEPSLQDSYDGIVDWVASRLWEASDVDSTLVLALDALDDDDDAA
jgi:hypothetical protein